MRTQIRSDDEYERLLAPVHDSPEQCERKYEQTDFAHDLNPDSSPGESWFQFFWSWILGPPEPQG